MVGRLGSAFGRGEPGLRGGWAVTVGRKGGWVGGADGRAAGRTSTVESIVDCPASISACDEIIVDCAATVALRAAGVNSTPSAS